MQLARFQPTDTAKMRIQFREKFRDGIWQLDADEKAFHFACRRDQRSRLQSSRNIVRRFVGCRFFEGECEQGADETERRSRKKWRVAVLRDRFSKIEGEQPAAQKRAEQSRGAASRLQNAEGAALPRGFNHL